MTNENVWRVAKRTSEGRGRQMRSLAHAAGFQNAKMRGGVGGVDGLGLFLGKYAMFQTAATPPSGGLEGDQRGRRSEALKRKRWPRKAQKNTKTRVHKSVLIR